MFHAVQKHDVSGNKTSTYADLYSE